MSAFAHLCADTAPLTIPELLRRVRQSRVAGGHDIGAHADLFAALERTTGLSLDELWALHDFVPTPVLADLQGRAG